MTSDWVGQSGSWTDGSNWSTAPAFPENGAQTYAASITDPNSTGNVAVTLTRDLTIDSLTLGLVSLTTNGALDVAQGAAINGSTLSGSGSLVLNGTSTLQNSLFMSGGVVLDNRGTLSAVGNVALTTVSGALPGPSLSNEGTFIQATQGETDIDVPLNNSGTVEVHAGSLVVGRGGTSSGTFQIDGNRTLELDSANLLAGSQVIGTGSATLGGGTVIAGHYAIGGTTTVDLATATLRAGGSTGSLVLEGIYNEGLTLGANLAVQNGFTWTGGLLAGPGTVTFPNKLTLTDAGFGFGLDTTLTAAHGLQWNPGTFYFFASGELVNPATQTATLNAGSGNIVGVAEELGSGSFVNQGTIAKLGSYSASFPTFSNSGSVQINAGTLAGTGLFTNSGSISIAAGASLQVGGLFNTTQIGQFTDTSVVTGAGGVTFSTGTHTVGGVFAPGSITLTNLANVRINAPISTFGGPLEIDSGVLSFATPVTLTDLTSLGGTLDLRDGSEIDSNFSGGNFTGDGTVTLTGNTTLLNASSSLPNLRNTGTITLQALGLQPGSTLTNEVGGVIHGGYTGYVGVSGGEFVNRGSFIVDYPTYYGSGAQGGVSNLVNSGTVEVEGGAFGSGFGSSLELNTYQQTAGVLKLSGGFIQMSTTTPLELHGGSLVGSGSVAGNVESNGRIAPGDSGAVGQLQFLSKLTLDSSSDLDFELAGTSPGSYDVMNVGQIFLDGDLSVRFLGGFEHQIKSTDSFEIIGTNTAIQGFFANAQPGERLRTADGLGSFAVLYDVAGNLSMHSIVLDDFVPEPGIETLLGSSLLAALVLQPFRRRATMRPCWTSTASSGSSSRPTPSRFARTFATSRSPTSG